MGPSGSGKSTIVSLLERFYQPQNGKILLDQKPLVEYKDQYLHEKVILFFPIYTLRRYKSCQEGVVLFQKVQFCTIFIPKGCIVVHVRT